jgi:hypothetical protein
MLYAIYLKPFMAPYAASNNNKPAARRGRHPFHLIFETVFIGVVLLRSAAVVFV